MSKVIELWPLIFLNQMVFQKKGGKRNRPPKVIDNEPGVKRRKVVVTPNHLRKVSTINKLLVGREKELNNHVTSQCQNLVSTTNELFWENKGEEIDDNTESEEENENVERGAKHSAKIMVSEHQIKCNLN